VELIVHFFKMNLLIMLLVLVSMFNLKPSPPS
jgi:hypothetical protein